MGHDTPSYLHQLIAEQMREELASRRLDVVLVPSPVERWPTDRQRRVVCERNPADGFTRSLKKQQNSMWPRSRANRANGPRRSNLMHTAVNHFNDNNAMPRDLRDDGPAAAGAGKTYAVDPAAVARLKAHVDSQKTAAAPQRQTAVPSVSRATPEPAASGEQPTAALYPAAVIAAAKEQEQATGRRNLAKVLTDDVLAIWDRWNNDGMSFSAIGHKANNQLIELAAVDVGRYLRKYRSHRAAPVETAVAQLPPRPSSPAKAETAVAQPAPVQPAEPTAPEATTQETGVAEARPETAAEPFAVQKPDNLPPWLDRDYAPPRPGPGDALAVLAALVNDQSIRVRGSVKLNLEIEFGE